MASVRDLSGQKFGRLTVIKRHGINKQGHVQWLCQCDCGKTTIVDGTKLTSNWTKSCGCLRNDLTRERIGRIAYKHGKSNTKVYKEWSNMKDRCNNPNSQWYHRYGGRGITVYEPWQNNFEAFYDDVSKLPYFDVPGYSLDRINNDGNYDPTNVRWTDEVTQKNNKSNNVRITFNDDTHIVGMV